MNKTMRLEIYFTGGGYIERELTYTGKDLQEIAREIRRDENDLLEYLMTGNDKGVKAFCFGGFMVTKKNITAAKLSEPFFD